MASRGHVAAPTIIRDEPSAGLGDIGPAYIAMFRRAPGLVGAPKVLFVPTTRGSLGWRTRLSTSSN
jgi:hypothetical protein